MQAKGEIQNKNRRQTNMQQEPKWDICIGEEYCLQTNEAIFYTEEHHTSWAHG